MTARDLKALLASTTAAQTRAADPTASAWVAANAGTGKTHVLTSRVLRLLLAGTKPERILCLTFTKAAAAEMSTRVFARLAEWVSAPDDKLRDKLRNLLNRQATPDETARARQLFALAIETPGGLKVQTIHAFCERLLQRFPLEAGVPPGFTILDDEHARTLMREAIDVTLLNAAGPDADPALNAALETVVVHAADDRFDRLLEAMIAKRDWLDSVRPHVSNGAPSFAEAEERYRVALAIRKGVTLDRLTDEIAALLSPDLMQRAITALSGGTTTDQDCADILRSCTNVSTTATAAALAGYFLTGKGEPRKSLMTKKVGDAHPDIREALTTAQGRFVALHEERRGLLALEGSLALVRLADAVRTDYATRKARRAALDYDDLIARAAHLLTDAGDGAAQWVLYKLDGGLDHILVDEAQDTSPTQWRVIANLAEEFFSDAAGHGDALRTVFAVGDEKQSIYGFQGAAPHMLAEVGGRFSERVRDVAREWHDVSLTLSFRSTRPVLDAVDAVFANSVRTPGVASASAIRHQPAREGHAGLVEIWESEPHEDAEDTDAFMPLDERPTATPVARLAARIADQIQHWLDTGERLESEDRPIRAGDILILVRRRAAFAPAMIAALKQRGIPVSGADRMQLEHQIAVQDLIAAGDVVLLPEDDLSLASVLKSPLVGLDDDDLMRFAPGRKGSLWTALIEAARNGDARLAAAAEIVKRWRRGADYRPPFEFYAEILDGDGGRAKLLARLGPEAADAIDEFMNLALRYDEAEPPSLQGFLDSLRRSRRQIKRDLEHGGNLVRVMTVHGAKGLEAPIVFLPETCSTRSADAADALIEIRSTHGARPVVWPLKGTGRVAAIVAAKGASRQDEIEERNRLLYVAMTRARDRLYVCGFEGKKGRDRDCWYDLIHDGLTGRLESASAFDGRAAQRLRQAQQVPPARRTSDTEADAGEVALPEWTNRRPPREPAPAVPIAPSRLAPLDIDADGEPIEPTVSSADMPVRRAAPGTTIGGANRFLRGTLTHALLQYLPMLPSEGWKAAATAFVKTRGAALPSRIRTSIVEETLAVLHDPGFAAVFGPRSRAEVAIVTEIAPPGGKGPPLRIAGQIDRLVETGGEVLIVDYKTNRPPPRNLAEVPRAYVHQLAGYRLAVQRVFGTTRVRAALLWTEGASMMEVPADQLDAAATELFTLS